MSDETLIARETERGGRSRSYDGWPFDNTEILCSQYGIIARWGVGGSYNRGEVVAPWADVLMHAPLEALVEALKAHGGQVHIAPANMIYHVTMPQDRGAVVIVVPAVGVGRP